MVGVVAPVFHNHLLAALAVKFKVSPIQILVLPPGMIAAFGIGLTVTTVAAEVAEQPFELITATVFTAEELMFTD
jgi:hypothetical protein